ncbi:hypothetical protein Tco_1580532, partial [Tanacetum coccineum]
VSNWNSFYALNSVENDDELVRIRGIQSLLIRGRSGVVSSAHGALHVAYGNLNTTPLAERINKLERRMIDGKLMLVDDDEKPLHKVDSDSVNSDDNSDVEVAYDETTQFMACGGANDASLYDDEEYDMYDSYGIEGLMKQELTLCDMIDIDFRGHS